MKLHSLHYKITKMQGRYNKAHSAYLVLEEVRRDIYSIIKENEDA